MILDLTKVTGLEVEGVDSRDYPSFCDAFFSYGEYNGEEMTEEQLNKFGEDYPELLSELAYQSLI